MTAVAVGVLAVLLLASFATAIVPMGPPEAMVVALTVAASTSPEWAIAVAITAACGQAAGKLLVFLAVRVKVLRRRVRLLDRLLHNRLLTKVDSFDAKHPRHLAAVVGVSALVSVPPLVVVSPMAGSTAMRPHLFLISAFAGRLGRFGLLAFVPSLLW